MTIDPPRPTSPSETTPPPPYNDVNRPEARRRPRARQRNRVRNINIIRREILRDQPRHEALPSFTRTLLNGIADERNLELCRIIVDHNCCSDTIKILLSRGTIISCVVLVILLVFVCLLSMRLYLL